MAISSNQQILQLIPANDWYAAFNDMDTGEQFYTPLVCWALVTAAGVQTINGMVVSENTVIICTDDPNFSHYIHQIDLEETLENAESIPDRP